MVKFFKVEIIVEADNPGEAERVFQRIINQNSSVMEMWLKGSVGELSKEEVMEFFGYDEETYKEMVVDF